jgi:hypothetical protein
MIGDHNVSNNNDFYVYLLRDPRPGNNLQPIYVGKGKGRRAHHHLRNIELHPNPLLRRVLTKIKAANLIPIIKIVARFTDEAAAFNTEINLIALYGRRDLKRGPLCNLTDGGQGLTGNLAVIKHMRQLNANPEFAKANAERGRKTMARINANPELTKANGKRGTKSLAKSHTDPEWKARRSAWMIKLNADPEFAAANAERGRKKMQLINAKRAAARLLPPGTREPV